jgi:CRISPR/Cas system-associated exonuclease Cas4 (RecB family)
MSGEKEKIDLEYLFAFSALIQQLNNLLADYPSEMKIEGLNELFKQVVQSTSLPFYGEPLRGIQVMGMLETRTLDFENLIILSCNEDLLPSGKTNSSYIPLDIKRNFGLPTYRHKDSVYAYHFYRLIQRAKNIRILYSTEPDQLRGGERSRFLRQITDELPSFNPRITISESILATPAEKSGSFPAIQISKTGDTLASLEQKAVKGFSASSLNAYRNCPLKFYFSEIAALREPEDVEDTIDPAVMGSAVHAALYKLYEPLKNRSLRKEDLVEMALNVDEAVNKAFENKFKGSDIAYGENLLRVSVAKLMIKRFLNYESGQLEELESSGGSCMVTMLEHFAETTLNIPYGDKSLVVRLKGVIDRVDKMDGGLRIIDYKTGTILTGQLKVNEWEDLIRDPTLNIGFQLLMYAWLLGKKHQLNAGSGAGIISLKRISAGYTTVSVPGEDSMKLTSVIRAKETQQFENVLIMLLNEIFDKSVPFVQTDDLAICANCPYINLCGR